MVSGDAVGAEDVQEENASYEGVEERRVPLEEEVKAIEGEIEDEDEEEAPSTLSRK